MFINRFMNGTAFFRSPEGEDGAPEKTPVQLAREEIAKNTKVAVTEPEPKGDSDKDGEDDKTEDDPVESDEEADEEEVDQSETDEEVEGETDEDKATRLANAANEKEKRRQARVQKRIDKAVAEKKAAQAEAAELRSKLEAKPANEQPGLTQEDVKKQAAELAAQQRAEEDFNKACEKLANGAVKIDKDFTKKVEAMAELNGPIPGKMIGILEELDNGSEVLVALTKDEDLAEDIYALKDSPEKMAIKLVKLSDKLIAAKKKAPKEISKVPNPNEPIRAGGRVNSNHITSKDTKPENMADFVAKRNAQDAEKRKQRGY